MPFLLAPVCKELGWNGLAEFLFWSAYSYAAPGIAAALYVFYRCYMNSTCSVAQRAVELQRKELKRELNISGVSREQLESDLASLHTPGSKMGTSVGDYLDGQTSLSDAAERNPLFGVVDDRAVIISWGLRQPSILKDRAPWEPQHKGDTSGLGADEKPLYDLRIAISLRDARVLQLMGMTTVNIVDTFDGYEGSIWADQQSFRTPLFPGADAAGDRDGLGAALEIGDGFRMTLRDGMCVLDSLGVADGYGAEDVRLAVDYVAKLETNLVSMIETAFEPHSSVPTPVIAHLATQYETVTATDALYRVVFEREEVLETGPALRSLLKRRTAASLRRELLDCFSRTSLSRTLGDIILERGDLDEASLIKLLDGCPLDASTLSVQEEAILARLSRIGGAHALQTIGTRLSQRASTDMTNSWERGYESARLSLIARHGGDQTWDLSLPEELSDGIGLSLPDPSPDPLDRLDALKTHEASHANRQERATQASDESLE